jgi:hypothetical protein
VTHVEPEMNFNLPVPSSDWRRNPNPAQPTGAHVLASLIHPLGPEHGQVDVYSLALKQEVHAGDYLLFFLEINRAKPLQIRVSASSGGLAHEAIAASEAEQETADGPLLMRVGVYRSGTHLFIVRCAARLHYFRSLVYDFAATIKFFYPQELKPTRLVGTWPQLCVGGICLQAPGRSRPIFSKPAQHIGQISYNLTDKKISTGLLVMRVIAPHGGRSTPPHVRLENLMKSLEGGGLRAIAKSPLRSVASPSLPGPLQLLQAEYHDLKGTPMALFAVSGQSQGSGFVIWLVTVSREVDSWAWMANKRAFDIMFSTLQPAHRSIQRNDRQVVR